MAGLLYMQQHIGVKRRHVGYWWRIYVTWTSLIKWWVTGVMRTFVRKCCAILKREFIFFCLRARPLLMSQMKMFWDTWKNYKRNKIWWASVNCSVDDGSTPRILKHFLRSSWENDFIACVEFESWCCLYFSWWVRRKMLRNLLWLKQPPRGITTSHWNHSKGKWFWC